MLLLLSPSKTLDFKSNYDLNEFSFPRCMDKTLILINELKKYSSQRLAELMGISLDLAELNLERFHNFKTPLNLSNSRQAIVAYKGDVYHDIEVVNYKADDYKFAQKHVRIISGLFGLLRPLDLIQPYRLEMKVNLKVSGADNLYDFWKSTINQSINSDLSENGFKEVVNLSSNEYFSVVERRTLKSPIINITFKEHRDGKYKAVMLFVKRARGMMANFIIKNRINKSSYLKKFNKNGYKFNTSLSDSNNWIFTRDSIDN